MRFNYNKYFFKISLIGFIVYSLGISISILFEVLAPSGKGIFSNVSIASIFVGLYFLISTILLRRPYLIIEDSIITLRIYYILSNVTFSFHDIESIVLVNKEYFLFFPISKKIRIHLYNGKCYTIYSNYLNYIDWINIARIFNVDIDKI